MRSKAVKFNPTLLLQPKCGSTDPVMKGVVMTTSMLLGWWICIVVLSWVGGAVYVCTYWVINTNMRDHRCIITFPRHNPNITFLSSHCFRVRLSRSILAPHSRVALPTLRRDTKYPKIKEQY